MMNNLIFFGLCFFILTSCEKAVEPDSIKVSRDLLIGRWKCTAEDSKYDYFEFTNDYFAIAGKNRTSDGESPIVYSGTYAIQRNKVRLDNVGLIEVNTLNDKVLSFMFTDKKQQRTLYRTQKQNVDQQP